MGIIMSTTQQPYLSFRIGHQWYGVRVEEVIEVLYLVALTELPGAPPDVLGLLALRDSTMPVIDLRARFGLDDVSLALDTPIIALQVANSPVGIVVDQVEDVEEIVEMVDYQGTESPYVIGAAKLEGELLLLLNTAKLHSETIGQPCILPGIETIG